MNSQIDLQPAIAHSEEAVQGLLSQLSSDDLIELKSLLEANADPTKFARKYLNKDLTPDQQLVLTSLKENKKTIVRSGHGVGKTNAAATGVLWYYNLYSDAIILTTAPSWASVRDLLWAEISEQYRHSTHLPPLLRTSSFNDYDGGIPLTLRHSEFHYAKGHNARTPEGFQGRHGAHMLIVLDEGAGVPEHIWAASNTMLQSDECRILVIGNPTTTSGTYYESLFDPTWNTITLSVLNHPNIAAELQGLPAPFPAAVRLSWLEEMIEKEALPTDAPDSSSFQFNNRWYNPTDEFRIRVLGLSPLKSSTSIFAEEWVNNARNNPLQDATEGPLQVGADIARYGNDKTVIMARKGNAILPRTSILTKSSTVDSAGAIIRMLNELALQYEVPPAEIPVAVDDDGVGGGVTDLLRNRGYFVIAVNGASTPNYPTKYPNKRCEMWFEGAELLRAQQLDLSLLGQEDFRSLKADLLSTHIQKYDLKGRRVLEPKEITRKRIGRSPDYADAFLLACAPLYRNNFNGAFRGEQDIYDLLSQVNLEEGYA